MRLQVCAWSMAQGLFGAWKRGRCTQGNDERHRTHCGVKEGDANLLPWPVGPIGAIQSSSNNVDTSRVCGRHSWKAVCSSIAVDGQEPWGLIKLPPVPPNEG